MEKRYLLVFKVAPIEGVSSMNVTKDKDLFIECPTGNYTEKEVRLVERNGTGVVLVEGIAGNRVHLRPRNDDRWLMFGGTFATTSDSRFPYDRPVHIHDRYEG